MLAWKLAPKSKPGSVDPPVGVTVIPPNAEGVAVPSALIAVNKAAKLPNDLSPIVHEKEGAVYVVRGAVVHGDAIKLGKNAKGARITSRIRFFPPHSRPLQFERQ